MGQELLSTGLSLLVILDVFLVERDKDDYAGGYYGEYRHKVDRSPFGEHTGNQDTTRACPYQPDYQEPEDY
jgi:hypothetical protein